MKEADKIVALIIPAAKKKLARLLSCWSTGKSRLCEYCAGG